MSLAYTVCYADTDAGGIVYHARYFEMAERSRNQLLSSLGFSLTTLKDRYNSLLVVHKIDAKFNAPALLEDKLQVRSNVVKATDVRSSWRTDVWRGDQCLCTITTVIVCVGADSRRLDSFPLQLLESMQIYSKVA